MRAFSYTSDAKKLSACFAVCEVVDEAVPMVVLSSTVPTFLVVHETEYAREFIEAEVASFSLPLAEFVFGEPVGLPDRIVGHAGAVEQLGRLGIHAMGDGSLRPGRKSVANGAILFVDLGAGKEIFFIGWDR